MFLLDEVVVYSATDLALAAGCEFAALRLLDVRLGRAERVDAADAMLERTARLGDAHEARVLAGFREQFGPYDGTAGVAEIEPARPGDRASLLAKRDETLDALRAGADVVFQGSFFDGRFHGRSDFLVREANGEYAVHDTKLARHAKVEALLQLAAYADQLRSAGIVVAPDVVLILGDGSPSHHPVLDLLPVYHDRRARLQLLLDGHQGQDGPVRWGDDRYLACGRCDVCAAEVEASHDVLLVAGMRVTQRDRLRANGITTIEQLAASAAPVEGMAQATLDRLRQQAALQVGQRLRPELGNGRPDVAAVVIDRAPLAALPAPDAGDIFFDFEGDPLWAENGSGDWGLEYLFGVMEADSGKFRPFWAHDRRQERQALAEFLAYVAARRAAHPRMHIYHYAPYERTALLRLAGRHGVGEQAIDDLLRGGVLVDLYATVRQGLRVSQPSYSLKKLEPLYMGDELRTGVDNAADSIALYAAACELRESGDDDGYQERLDAIAAYNAYDCRSTFRLRDWLLDTVVREGITAADLALPEVPEPAIPDPLEVELLALAGDVPRDGRSADQQAYAMLAAALGYHRREDKPFWWGHFDRLSEPVDEWADTRDVFLPERVQVVRDWHKEGKQRLLRRHLRMVGELPVGGTGIAAVGAPAYCVHQVPPAGVKVWQGCVRATTKGTVVESSSDGARAVLVVAELLPKGCERYDLLPMALTPTAPPPAGRIVGALAELAGAVLDGGLVAQPGLDLLRLTPPRTTVPLPALSDPVETITAAVRSLDRSYLGVQGPPGTGKTYVGSRVVARLVAEGWRVGVVAQSHAAVEHFLDQVVAAGVDPTVVGKKPNGSSGDWTEVPADDYAGFLAEHQGAGCVLGGTAWDFTNADRVGRRELDLLVVDEAGQYSLANTVAVSVACDRLLLLGDPQQLPQVSQGTHPEPVDGSALGWLAEGHARLPAERGYFLDRSWRMHPALCARVSRLSYDDQLRSNEQVTTARALSGYEPGVHIVPVEHLGSSVCSHEEAAEVVRQVRSLVGLPWCDGRTGTAPLGAEGIMVVAPYNAQVTLIARALDGAGLTGVRVGTVDRFQGQQAPVVIVSMAASSAADVPRGMGFLLSRNRVNVAVSRAQWAAIVVRSPLLTDYLPATPEQLAELGAFLGLGEPTTA